MSLDDAGTDLRRLELFSVFEPEALRLLAVSLETVSLGFGGVLFRRDDASDGGYILASGAIEMFLGEGEDGSTQIRQPGTLLGETALMAATRRSITAVASEPATLLKISRGVFLEVLDQYPATAARVRMLVKTRLLRFLIGLKLQAAAWSSSGT